VVFLDIKMPQEDGFSFLKSLPDRSFSVIFTTAHNEFALKAFREDAIDYLEKPISVDDLRKSVEKLMRIHKDGGTNMTESEALRDFFKDLTLFPENEKTAIPTRDGYVVLRSKDIVRLEASDSYTNIYLADGKRYMSSKNIKVYEDKLNKAVFFRTHKSHIINTMYHLEAFTRTDGNFAILSDKSSVPVSRRKLPEFLHRIATV
jgi:two-component system LytT family response regulator